MSRRGGVAALGGCRGGTRTDVCRLAAPRSARPRTAIFCDAVVGAAVRVGDARSVGLVRCDVASDIAEHQKRKLDQYIERHGKYIEEPE